MTESSPQPAAMQPGTRRRRVRALALLAGVIGAAVVLGWWYGHRNGASADIVLYGNVDLREVDLAFNDSGRIASIAVDEGDRVRAGEVVARLDTSRLRPMLAQALAQAAAERAVLARLQHGSRPQEIAQAREFRAQWSMGQIRKVIEQMPGKLPPAQFPQKGVGAYG